MNPIQSFLSNRDKRKYNKGSDNFYNKREKTKDNRIKYLLIGKKLIKE